MLPESCFFSDGWHLASESLDQVLPEFWRLLRQDFGDNLTVISDSSLCSVNTDRYRDLLCMRSLARLMLL
jgi:hypothetical protein